MERNVAEVWRQLGPTLNAIREGIQIIGFDWRYLYVNDAVCTHGKRSREDLLGFTMMEAYPGIENSDVFRVLGRCMTERRVEEVENEFTYPDGSRTSFELRIEPCPEGIFVLSVDITERKRLEVQLRQAQKMDAVGKLAGGVAHDFNNMLTAIKSFTEFAIEALPDQHPALGDLREVQGAADRAVAITQQLLAFARSQPIRPRVVDVGGLLASVDKLLRRLIGEDIEIVTRVDGDGWRTLIDPGAFEQVLVNLALNARDAMPGGGRLTIETTSARLDEAQSLKRGGLIPAGDYVVLAVSDDGVGMDVAIQEQIFEPFFTTKDVGKGTGLGLSTSYGIVRQAGGYIWVYSEPGHGTTFKIYLPRSTEERDEVVPPSLPESGTTGSETLLVVEDDPQVRQIVSRSLTRLGYVVLVAASGDEALALCDRHGGPLDLLLTDVVMPGMNGRELATKLMARAPGLQVLYVSGYTATAIVQRGVLPAGTHMLAKPFTPKTLAARVREVLDGREG